MLCCSKSQKRHLQLQSQDRRFRIVNEIGSKSLPVLCSARFSVQVVILFNRQLIKLWKGAQTPWEKLEKVLFFSLSQSALWKEGRHAIKKANNKKRTCSLDSIKDFDLRSDFWNCTPKKKIQKFDLKNNSTIYLGNNSTIYLENNSNFDLKINS